MLAIDLIDLPNLCHCLEVQYKGHIRLWKCSIWFYMP